MDLTLVFALSWASLLCSRLARSVSTGPSDVLVSIQFPVDVTQGDNVTLACHYDMKGREFHSLRWYFNGQQVYRYTDRPKPSKKGFTVPGVTLNVSPLTDYLFNHRTDNVFS